MPRLSKIGAAALAAFGWTSGGAAAVTANYLVVAGGGSGANALGGGGGAGGYQTGTTSLNTTLSYTVIVGAGGAGTPASTNGIDGNNGNNSVFGTITSIGGGGGGSYTVGRSGGSGGGGGISNSAGGAGTAGQGNAGGTSNNSYPQASGGGGGAGAAGANASGSSAGAGGNGLASSISGTSVTYAGGGGGSYNADASGSVGAGGSGGATAGGNAVASLSAAANTGSGSGGGGYYSLAGGNANKGSGNGGSGVVIISYAGAQQFGGGVVTSVGGNTIHTFTTSGTLSPLSSLTASYLIVAGGGGGGGGYPTITTGGGGGAGGMQTGSGLTIDPNSTYLVTVGAGGAAGGGGAGGSNGGTGGNSAFSMVSTASVGGGYGAWNQQNGGNGGSGGGASGPTTPGSRTGGTGTSGQGNAGGNAGQYSGAGGGGAGAVGGSSPTSSGGAGLASSISGTSTFYAGGGGSAGFVGGAGGGGNGSDYPSGTVAAGAGTANTGGGGGSGGNPTTAGASGGSGIVIISYPGSTPQMAGGTVTAAGGNIIHTFTSSGYLTPITNLNNSLRFRSSASARLTRTPTVTSNTTTWTWSAWIKRGTLSTTQHLFYAGNGSNLDTGIFLTTSNNLLFEYDNFGTNYYIQTSAVYRDPAAWYHIVLVYDSTQATSSNRIQLYVNGSQVTAFSASNYPTLNFAAFVNNSSYTHSIASKGTTNYFDGYMADINFVDGQALTPSSFGAFNGQGVWQPVRYGGSYGTNGFYLPFNGSSNSTFAGSFNGSNQSLSVPTSSQFSFSGDFTWEAWVLLNVVPSSGGASSIITSRGSAASDSAFQFLITDNSGQKNFGATLSIGSTDYNDFFPITPFTLTAGTWNHYAYVRSGSTVTAYFNGVAIGSATGRSGTTNTPSVAPSIGVRGGSYNDLYLNGYISNLRMVGSAVYTGNFTPPTSALTAISGTRLLTLQNSTIIDNSPNAFSITNNNGVTTSTQYPYVVTAFLDQGPVGNNWTPNNISGLNGSTYDFMRDVPTNTSATVANYCTMNPLQRGSGVVLSQGNLNIATPGGSVSSKVLSTIGMTTGKWYCETIINSSTFNYGNVGLGRFDTTFGSTSYLGNDTTSWCYAQDGNIYTNGTGTAYGNTYTAGDIIGIAFDADNGRMFFSKNGVFQNSGNPVTGTNPAVTGLTSGPYFFGQGASPSNVSFNFGQQPFAYTPPAGFVALNTFNLPTPTIGATPATTANKYMDVTTYTGNGAARNIINSGSMQPDWVWLKSRVSSVWYHQLYDVLRAPLNSLASNRADPTYTYTDTLTAFNSNGFSLGTDATWNGPVNKSGDTYVAWQWKANGAGITNTDGSITSTVSVNTTAGFSIVTYTGTGANGTVGHGLGVAPKFWINKSRNTATDWYVNTTVITGGVDYLVLNNTAAASSTGGNFANPPTSSVIYLGSATGYNGSGDLMVSYLFTPVAGYSAFGTYTGNGSTDGPFIYTGFRPRFVLIKLSSAGGTNWEIYDSARNTYNATDLLLLPSSSSAEGTFGSYPIDLLSNGFKVRGTGSGLNDSGQTLIYAAFAENPFKYANAR